jgi:hypothetical protein
VKVKDNNQLDISDRYTSLSKNDETVSKNAKVILKLRVKSVNKEYLVRTMKAGELLNSSSEKLKVSDLENFLISDKYNLESSSNDEVTFIKESKFEPDKFYLGPNKDGLLAIFKCDIEGNLFIEDEANDVSEKKVSSLPSRDREFINNYDYKYENKEAAQDELTAICS